jgi:hypothetical protein
MPRRLIGEGVQTSVMVDAEREVETLWKDDF